jgi:hypothetical protein
MNGFTPFDPPSRYDHGPPPSLLEHRKQPGDE